MQAIILAAGFGKRLRPITDHMPKSMVPVKGTPLLENTLNLLAATGKIDNVVIVVGHMAEYIIKHIGNSWKGMSITYVENSDYDKTNNVYSLYLARDYIHDDCIMLECDLYYGYDLIEKILSGEAECNILVSEYNPVTMNGSVILSRDGVKASSLVIKRDQYEGFPYEEALKTVNVYKFSKNFICNQYFPMVDLYVKIGNINSYYELVLGAMIYYGNNDIRIVKIDADRWYEIDDENDLAIAEAAKL